MALWKARGGNLNKELEFRSWHCGRQEGGGSLNKELDFRSWHRGRQANYILDHAFDERTLSGFEAFEGTLKGLRRRLRRYLKPLPKGGRRWGVNEEPKPLRYLKGALRYLKRASKASKVS